MLDPKEKALRGWKGYRKGKGSAMELSFRSRMTRWITLWRPESFIIRF